MVVNSKRGINKLIPFKYCSYLFSFVYYYTLQVICESVGDDVPNEAPVKIPRWYTWKTSLYVILRLLFPQGHLGKLSERSPQRNPREYHKSLCKSNETHSRRITILIKLTSISEYLIELLLPPTLRSSAKVSVCCPTTTFNCNAF